MDYEATLSSLVGLIGRDVTVVIGGARGRAMPEHIATFTGELTAAQEVQDRATGPGGAEPEALFFQIDADERAGFLVERALFREAYWNPTATRLAIYLGDMKLQIEQH